MRKGHADRIGNYIIKGVLGHGSMGSVYRVIVPDTGRIVALKVLNLSGPLADFLDEAILREIFTTEVLTMSRLNHPNIAEVLDFELDHGRPYYTMEYLCNNLGMLIGEKFVVEETSRLIPPDKAVEYGCQVLAGLKCMHSDGIIHRDIKPFNMMITDNDSIKICDFGMVKLQDEKSFEAKGINIGTPYYMSPEQMGNPEHADKRSDLYSMGVMLYRMITGELPSMKNFMLSRINPLYARDWDAFFAKALNWKPSLRFQSAQEMTDKLLQLKLHWEKKRVQACSTSVLETGSEKGLSLRSIPVRTSGAEARDVFGVDDLWQPYTYIGNRFKLAENDMVLDEATMLIWQRAPSDYSLDRLSADEFIESLNEIRFKGINSWRLPTVNELLSLVTDPAIPTSDCHENPFITGSDWFWSCDRRSKKTSWYVNIKLGYTGWQNNSCHYLARAVASRADLTLSL